MPPSAAKPAASTRPAALCDLALLLDHGPVEVCIGCDGADPGGGIFSLSLSHEHGRGAITQALAGTWEANETWLIVAGGVLFGLFPFVYGSAFSLPHDTAGLRAAARLLDPYP